MDGCRKALHYVGRKFAEFFGVSEEENIIWRGAFENKAQTGRVGLPLGYVLSNEDVVYAKDKMVHELQESISRIALDKEDVGVSNHVLSTQTYHILGSEHLLKVPSMVCKTPNTSVKDIIKAQFVNIPKASPQVEQGRSGVGDKEDVGVSNHVLRKPTYHILGSETLLKVPSMVGKTPNASVKDIIKARFVNIPKASPQVDIDEQGRSGVPIHEQQDNLDLNTDDSFQDNNLDSTSFQDWSFKSATSILPEALEGLHESSSIQGDVFFDAEKDFNNSAKETEFEMTTNDGKKTLNNSIPKEQEASNIEAIKNSSIKTTKSPKALGSSLLKRSTHGKINSVYPMNFVEVSPNVHENKNNSMESEDDKEAHSFQAPGSKQNEEFPGSSKQSNLNEKDELQDLTEHEINSSIQNKKEKDENSAAIRTTTTTDISGKTNYTNSPKFRKRQKLDQMSNRETTISDSSSAGASKACTSTSGLDNNDIDWKKGSREIDKCNLDRRFFSACQLECDKNEKRVSFSQPASLFDLKQEKDNTFSISHSRGLWNHSSKHLSLLENDVLIEEEDVKLTGNEALEFYKQFTSLEKELKIKEINETKNWVIENYKWRIDMVNLLSATAKEYYTNPQGEARRLWKNLRREIDQKSCHSLTDARVKEAELKQFKPYFTYILILVHIMTFCIVTSIGGFTTMALEQSIHLQDNVQTFLGTETVHDWKVPNIWIGTDMMSMIKIGAAHTPCIRRDYSLQLEYLQSYDTSKSLGCCEILMRNTAGTTTEKECDKETNGVGLWRSGVECSKRVSGQNHVAHILKPCCVGLKGRCQLVSHKHCIFLGGTFFREKDHCTQVNCLSNLCGTTPTMTSESTSVGYPVSPNQSWRVFVSLFYCHGVIHLLLLLCVEWMIMRMVERSSGWLRMMIVFIVSGLASVIAASIISPYTPQVGSTGGVFGAVGVAVVEVIQAWKILKNPHKELAKIIIFTAFFFISGLLPLVSNFAVVVGIAMGILSSMLLFPYITLGEYRHQGRIVMIIISLPLLFMMFFVLILTYVKVQNIADVCHACHMIDCVPFSDKICTRD